MQLPAYVYWITAAAVITALFLLWNDNAPHWLRVIGGGLFLLSSMIIALLVGAKILG